MSFWIQASSPKCLRVINEEDQSIGEAMETVFPMITEEALLVWHHVYVPLDYKGTVSFIITDALNMLESLARSDSGELDITWPSNTFAVVWKLKWSTGMLRIDSLWHTVIGGTESLLSARPTLTISKDAFIAEWKALLAVALKALTDAGYTDTQLADLARLREVHDKIPGPGTLYT